MENIGFNAEGIALNNSIRKQNVGDTKQYHVRFNQRLVSGKKAKTVLTRLYFIPCVSHRFYYVRRKI